MKATENFIVMILIHIIPTTIKMHAYMLQKTFFDQILDQPTKELKNFSIGVCCYQSTNKRTLIYHSKEKVVTTYLDA